MEYWLVGKKKKKKKKKKKMCNFLRIMFIDINNLYIEFMIKLRKRYFILIDIIFDHI